MGEKTHKENQQKGSQVEVRAYDDYDYQDDEVPKRLCLTAKGYGWMGSNEKYTLRWAV